MSIDLLRLGIFSLKHFYGAGLNFELVLYLSFGWSVGWLGTAPKALERLDKHSTSELYP